MTVRIIGNDQGNDSGADIRYGGDKAYYRPSTDHIQAPA